MNTYVETIRRNRPERDRALDALALSPVYKNSLLRAQLLEQVPFLDGEARVMAVADYDFTTRMHDDANPETLRLIAYLTQHNIPLINVTGNHLELQMQKYQEHGVPATSIAGISPDVGNGLSVQQVGGAWMEDTDFLRYIEETVGFKYDVMYPQCLEIMNQINADPRFQNTNFRLQPLYSVKNVLAHNPDLRQIVASRCDLATAIRHEDPVSAISPSHLKISFLYDVEPGNVALIKALKDTVTPLVQEVAPRAKTSTSIADTKAVDGRDHYNFDVIAVGKGGPLVYAAQKCGCVVASFGDSGNDRDMLIDAKDENIGMRVIVGNASPELHHDLAELRANHPVQRYGKYMWALPDGRLFFEDSENHTGPDSMLRAIKMGRRLFHQANSMVL